MKKSKPLAVSGSNKSSNFNNTINNNSNINNTSSQTKKEILINNLTDISLTTENLQSIHNQLEYLNLLIQSTFEKQKENTNRLLLERINDIIKLREYIFNVSSKLNNKVSISKVEDYFSVNYAKIISNGPKLNNIIENIDDLKTNINYGLDCMYLEDNIVCDEKSLFENIETAANSLEKLNDVSKENLGRLDEIRNNYKLFYQQIEEEKSKIECLTNLINNYKTNLLNEKIEDILLKLNNENKKIENDLFI